MTWLLAKQILTIIFGISWIISTVGLVFSIIKYHEYFAFSLIIVVFLSIVLAALNLKGVLQATAIFILIILLLLLIFGLFVLTEYGKAFGKP